MAASATSTGSSYTLIVTISAESATLNLPILFMAGKLLNKNLGYQRSDLFHFTSKPVVAATRQRAVSALARRMRTLLLSVLLSGCSSKTLLNPHHAPWATPARDAYTSTQDNLRSFDIVLGNGAEALNGMELTVHYNGWLRGGELFDSSHVRGQPFTAVLGQGRLIQGWEEGMLGMRVGGVRQLIIPPSLAYADRETGKIPPNSELVFEIELLGVRPAGR